MYILLNAATNIVQESLHLLSRRIGASKTGREAYQKHFYWKHLFYFCKRNAEMVVITSGQPWLRDITFIERPFWRVAVCRWPDGRIAPPMCFSCA